MSGKSEFYESHFSGRSAFGEWFFWLILLSAVSFCLIGSLLLPEGLFGFSNQFFAYAVIFLMGIVTLVKSGRDALFLSRETRIASRQVRELVKLDDIQQFIETSTESLFRSHIGALFSIFQAHHDISQDNLISFLNDKLSARNRVAELFSSILITLGLIGTIMGLILMVTDLRTALSNFDPSATDTFISTLTVDGGALAGLDTAFYTTLLGAIFGGVVLRILTSVVDANITKYVVHVAELTEIYVLPSMRSIAKDLDKAGFYSRAST